MTTWVDQSESLWLSEARSSVRAVPDLPARVDVVVVGGGLAGLCTALLCSGDGCSVAVVEADWIARRTTGHTTAKVTALHGLVYDSLSNGKSPDAAAAYAAANMAALDRLRATVRELSIACAWVDATAHTCAATPDGVAAIDAEAEAASAAGLAVSIVDSTELGGLVKRSVTLEGQAHFDPYAFCSGLADHLRAVGVTILEHRRVKGIDESSDGCVMTIDGGDRIECDAAVLTTHRPVVDPALLAGRVRPERSFAVAGASGSLAVTDMYLAHDAGWSLRPANASDGTPVLVVGGEGHSMTSHVDSARHYESLERLAAETFGVDEVGARWSAFDYVTTDGVPFIGRLAPGSKRRYVATGFRKWGMTTSMVSAMLISDAIAGRKNPYASTFDSTRLLPSVTRQLLTNSTHVAVRWMGDRVKAFARGSGTNELQVGEGRIERDGSAIVAVARDQEGTLHRVRATCTHMGCIVGFNDAEQTWDCPCHGSRFRLDGSVLDGPATTPLAPVEEG